ncbi:MAG: hypothetical protein ACXWJF_08200 [Burkholderiaceae bacterium]
MQAAHAAATLRALPAGEHTIFHVTHLFANGCAFIAHIGGQGRNLAAVG